MSTQWNKHWDFKWPCQPDHEVVVDARPAIAHPNHHGVYASAKRVVLRFMRLYQCGQPLHADGSIAGELVIHDLALVEFTWEAAKDLHARLGEELAREEERRGVAIERPAGCPYPMTPAVLEGDARGEP